MLEKTGLSTWYNHADEDTQLPFIIFDVAENDNFSADNKTYLRKYNLTTGLVTEVKDTETEKLLEDVFDDNDIQYTKNSSYDSDAKVYLTVYESEVI